MACLALAENPAVNKRSKHIDIKYHFLRHHVAKKEIILKYCPSKLQLADILTKALPEYLFSGLRDKLLGYNPHTGLPFKNYSMNLCKVPKEKKVIDKKVKELKKGEGVNELLKTDVAAIISNHIDAEDLDSFNTREVNNFDVSQIHKLLILHSFIR
jgi:hypothetical protein